MGSFSIWHWLVVLAIVALVFGTKKLRSLGGDLGGAVKGFKEAVNEVNSTAELDNLFAKNTVESDINRKAKQEQR